ncbi:MAG: glycosyltransferase family 2 protein [Verrucomicrobia bacterium]|nr:MAG: glycosyltransferase family 2 protein [Verrucomicrobiota bacterium]
MNPMNAAAGSTPDGGVVRSETTTVPSRVGPDPMLDPRECAAVVPCLNEAGSVGAVVRGLRPTVPTVIVVDDGSTDATGREAAGAGAEVIRLEPGMGKGAALARGWQRAAERGFQWVLCLDGDGQHDPSDAPAFLAAAASGARMVVGNRFHDPASMPRIRRITNRAMSRWISRRAGMEFPDSQCGYRLMHLPTLLALGLRTTHYEIESEMDVAFARGGHRVEFVPIRVLYGNERSKIRPVDDTLRWWRWWRG